MTGAEVDVAIVGGGPKGISLALRLWRGGIRDLVLIEMRDLVGTWDSTQAGTSPTRTGIYFSDTLVPGDSDIGPLPEFAKNQLSASDFARDQLPKEVLQDYYRQAVRAAGLPVRQGLTVRSATPCRAGYRLTLSDGTQLTARCLVDATGIVGSKQWPWWVREVPPDRYWHSIGHGVLNTSPHPRLVVVGGGHATPDIAVRMAELGSRVTVCVRNARLRCQLLPYAQEFLSAAFQRGYRHRNPQRRYSLLRTVARQCPWVTPRSYWDMVDFMAKQEMGGTGRIEVMLSCVVENVRWRGDVIEIQFNDNRWVEADGVICATGFRAQLPGTSGFEMPDGYWSNRVYGGYPVLDDQYRVVGTDDLFVLGYLAQLGQRGPIDSILHDSQTTTQLVASAIGQRLAHRYTGVGRRAAGPSEKRSA